MTSKKIGTITDIGVEWPDVTLSGKPYDKPPTQTRTIASDGRFVVLDPFAPVDQFGKPLFDVEGAIADLLKKDAPKSDDAPKAK